MSTRITDVAAHFDTATDEGRDAWNDESSWYEERKRAVVLASLPRRRYARAWEPACGGGLLSLALADRCDRVDASDASPRAVAAASTRTRDRDNVFVERAVLPSSAPMPDGTADLVVLSELLYYLTPDDRHRLLRHALTALGEDGDLVVVSWRHAAKDTFGPGSAVTAEAVDWLHAHGARTAVRHGEPDFVLEVLRVDGQPLS